jgi:hypothetical protein
VHGLTAGREGAGDGDQHDFLAGELLGGVVRLREAAGGRAGVGDRGPAVRSVSVDCLAWWDEDRYAWHSRVLTRT